MYGKLDPKEEWRASAHEFYEKFRVPDNKSTEFQAFRQFVFERPWFLRAWTYQESSLARDKTFLCGQLEVAKDDLEIVCAIMLKLCKMLNCPDYNFPLAPKLSSMLFHDLEKGPKHL